MMRLIAGGRGAVAIALSVVCAAGAARAADPTVGFIYVGPKDDYGYNQAHHQGAAAVKAAGVTVLEEEKVPETLDVQKTMESMIELDGATVLFPTSFGYFDPHILAMAKKYPEVLFIHCGGLYDAARHPTNVGSYFGYIDEGQYLNGIAAGFATKTNKLGFVAAKPIPQVLRNVNAFALGARSVNPKATVTVIFTGDWADPVKEAEAAKQLIDGGADVLTAHVDSPKVVVQTAQERGIHVAGYHTNQSALAPTAYLTGAEWNWAKVYQAYVDKLKAGEIAPDKDWQHLVRGGMKDGFVTMSPYGPDVSAESKQKIEAVKGQMTAGEFVIFKGPLKDNKGKVVIAEGVAQVQTDPELEKMSYLVEGVVGDTGM
jgi:basic membrane protein A